VVQPVVQLPAPLGAAGGGVLPDPAGQAGSRAERNRRALSIERVTLPEHAFLRAYLRDGGYADCYVTEIDQVVSQADFIEAFYTSPVFKLERWLLALLVAKPCTDQQVRELAAGSRERFSAWRVERQDAGQLLLCDFRGRTRSWLMATPVAGSAPARTRLYFGSAVVPARDATGGAKLGFAFSVLLGFHKLYSRTLLAAASRRLRGGAAATT
jgi:hypothetical protein